MGHQVAAKRTAGIAQAAGMCVSGRVQQDAGVLDGERGDDDCICRLLMTLPGLVVVLDPGGFHSLPVREHTGNVTVGLHHGPGLYRPGKVLHQGIG